MKIIYIANIRFPTEKAHGFQIAKMCEALVKVGHDVKLVIPWRINPIKINPENYYSLLLKLNISRIPGIDLVRFGRIGYISQTIFFALSSFIFLLFHDSDIVYTRNSSAIFLPLLFMNRKFVYEIHTPRFNFFVRKVMQRSDVIVTISQGLKEFLIEKGISGDKILIAPSGVDLDIFGKSEDKNHARDLLQIPKDKFILGYFGSFKTLGYEKGLRFVFESLKRMDEDIIFLAIGGRSIDVELYSKVVKEMGLEERVDLRMRIDIRRLPIYHSVCDVLIMPFPAEEHYTRFMSPVKMFEYMASGRPIISSNLPSIREILNDNSCTFYKAGDHEDFIKAVEFVRINKIESDMKTQKAFEDVKKYTWESRIAKLGLNK